MTGLNKAVLPLAGKALLQHVIDRVAPQVAELYLSVERPSSELASFGLPQVPDPEPDAGPLAGLLTALQRAGPTHEWLLLAPCDAPFIPLDLADRLQQCALSSGHPGAIVRYLSEDQPTFSIWNRSLLPRLERAVLENKVAGFKQFMQSNRLAVLDWPETDSTPFFNINDHHALQLAHKLLDEKSGATDSCSV